MIKKNNSLRHTIPFMEQLYDQTIVHLSFRVAFCSMIIRGSFCKKKKKNVFAGFINFLKGLSLTFYLNNYLSSFKLRFSWFLV